MLAEMSVKLFVEPTMNTMPTHDFSPCSEQLLRESLTKATRSPSGCHIQRITKRSADIAWKKADVFKTGSLRNVKRTNGIRTITLAHLIIV